MNFDRFLRFTTPGLVSLIIFYLLILTTNSKYLSLLHTDSIALTEIVAGVLLAGGLGYIYNSIYWAICHLFYFPLNHKLLLKSLDDKFFILDAKGKKVNKISSIESWSIFNTYWYSKTDQRKRFEDINPRVDRLSDITHGLGAANVGLLISFISWLILIVKFHFCDSEYLPPIVIFLTTLIASIVNYIYSLRLYQTILNTTFATIVNTEIEEKRIANPSYLITIILEK